jgi:hypothetical protein
VYYKIRAGLAPDTLTAVRLRERLVEAGAIRAEDASGGWGLIQHTPFAFDLGEFPTREAAQARADVLLQQNVSAYPVRVPYSDRSERWRLYGGAFADSANAETMRGMLAEAGLPTRLVPRTGGRPEADG